MKKTLSSYLWWTHERGSFHYDVMVTLILLFIFVTPRLWNYRDHPSPYSGGASQVLVKVESPDHFVYQVNAAPKDHTDLDTFLLHSIEPISGEVAIDKYEPTRDAGGKVTGYKVWAHR